MSLELSKENTDHLDMHGSVKLKITDEDVTEIGDGEEDSQSEGGVISDDDDNADDDNADDDNADDDEDDDDADDDAEVGSEADESKSEQKTEKTSVSTSSLSELLRNVSTKGTSVSLSPNESEDEDTDDDEYKEDYLQKINTSARENYILDFHPEKKIHNYSEVEKMSSVTRDKTGTITDPFHKTTSILSKYEKTKVLGQRAKQIENGCKVFVNVPVGVLDGYLIATEELNQKKLPFIIRRPIPNGGVEYWPVKELDNIH